MKADIQHDGDPRYGWVSIDFEGGATGLIVIHSARGSLGFLYSERDQSIVPTCICSAWCESECSCPHLDPGYWGVNSEED